MPRLRFRLPLEVEVTPEQLEAGRAVGEVLARVQRSELPGAILRAVKATRDAVRTTTRRKGRSR